MKNEQQCLRKELENCPYRHEHVDVEYWCHRVGERLEFAKERAGYYCQSIPCQYALEVLLCKLVQGKEKIAEEQTP